MGGKLAPHVSETPWYCRSIYEVSFLYGSKYEVFFLYGYTPSTVSSNPTKNPTRVNAWSNLVQRDLMCLCRTKVK